MVEIAAGRDRIAPVLTPADAETFLEEIALEYVRTGRGTADAAAHVKLGQRDTERTAELSAPTAGRTDHGRGSDTSMLGDDTGHAAGLDVDAAHGTARQDCCALAGSAPGYRGPCQVRFGTPVIGRVQAAGPGLVGAAYELVHLGIAEHAGLEAVILGDDQPVLEGGDFLLVLRREHAAAACEAGLFAELVGKSVPDADALHHDGQLARVTALLPHPAPVATGLLTGYVSLFAQRDVDALLREKPCRGHAEDAAADDDDIGGIGDSGGRLEGPLPVARDQLGIGGVGHRHI